MSEDEPTACPVPGPVELIPLDVAVDTTSIPRATFRVWRHRGRLCPVACDAWTHAELYDLAEVMRLERDTRKDRVRRMILTYR